MTTSTRAVVTDARPTELPELLSELRKVPPDVFALELASVSAVLEANSSDAALYNRPAAIALATAWIEAVGDPTPPEGGSVQLDELFRMANGLSLREPSTQLARTDLTDHNCRVMSRTFAQQNLYIDAIAPSFARTEILLSEALPSVLKQRANPLDALPAAMKMTYREARALTFGIYAWLLSSPSQRIDDASFSNTTVAKRFARALDTWARTPTELKSVVDSSKAYGYTNPADFRFTYSVLRDFPFVRVRDGIVCPIPRHLALMFSEGVYDFLRRHFGTVGNTELFDQVFGDTTEEYVRMRFERSLGGGAYKRLPEIKNELSPDGLSADGECVFELKGKRLPRGMITTGQLFGAKQFLGKKGLGKGIAQLLSEVQRTRAGRGRGMNATVETVSLCLVTPEGLPGFHFKPIKRWVVRALSETIRNDFPGQASELPALERFEWVSFDDLDALVLASRVSSTSIARLLQRFRLETTDHWGNLEGGTLSPPLPLWLRERYPAITRDSWLKDKYEAVVSECVTQLFGA